MEAAGVGVACGMALDPIEGWFVDDAPGDAVLGVEDVPDGEVVIIVDALAVLLCKDVDNVDADEDGDGEVGDILCSMASFESR